MLEWDPDYRQRVDEYKLAITKVIRKTLNTDLNYDDQFAVLALAELAATFGARVIGRERTSLILNELGKHVAEAEVPWPE